MTTECSSIIHKWDIYVTPSKARGTSQKRGQKNGKSWRLGTCAVSFEHGVTGAPMNSQQQQKMGPINIPSWMGGDAPEATPLPEELSAVNGC